MKTYIIVGDNNVWYSTVTINTNDICSHMTNVIKQIKNGDYDNIHDSPPNELFAYEAELVETVTVDL